MTFPSKSLCGYAQNDDESFPVEAYVELCRITGIPFPYEYKRVINKPFTFDRDGNAWKAAQHRNTFSIREFAEVLADCDGSQISSYDDQACEEYAQRVQPYVDLLIDFLEEEIERSDEVNYGNDDVPF